MQPVEVPNSPHELWSTDVVVPGAVANNTAAKVLHVVVDHATRCAWAFAAKSQTADATITIVRSLFDSVGKPERLIPDNGPNYSSNKFRKFLNENGVKHSTSSVYHPQANGLCEKVNGIIVSHMKRLHVEKPKLKWSSLVREAVIAYNEAPHSVMKFAPKFLLFGRSSDPIDENTTIEDAQRLAVERMRAAQEKRKERHDEKYVALTFEIGDLVKHKIPRTHPEVTKLSSSWHGPYKVTEKVGDETYRIERSSNQSRPNIVVHSSSIEKYNARDEDETLATPAVEKTTLRRSERISSKRRDEDEKRTKTVNFCEVARWRCRLASLNDNNNVRFKRQNATQIYRKCRTNGRLMSRGRWLPKPNHSCMTTMAKNTSIFTTQAEYDGMDEDERKRIASNWARHLGLNVSEPHFVRSSVTGGECNAEYVDEVGVACNAKVIAEHRRDVTQPDNRGYLEAVQLVVDIARHEGLSFVACDVRDHQVRVLLRTVEDETKWTKRPPRKLQFVYATNRIGVDSTRTFTQADADRINREYLDYNDRVLEQIGEGGDAHPASHAT